MHTGRRRFIFLANREWDCLTKGSHELADAQRKLLQPAFDEDAGRAYEAAANSYIGEPANIMSERLENCLFNHVHQSTLQNKYFD